MAAAGQCLALIGCWVAGSYDFEDRRPVPHSLSKDIMAKPGVGSVSNKTARVVTGRGGGTRAKAGVRRTGGGLVYRLRLSSRDTASRSTTSVKHVWCVALQLRQPLERRSRCGGTRRTGQRRRHGIYGTSLAVARGLVLCATAN